jgi:hypothetical protein
MPTLKNFVAVDWHAGKDKIYFFFKDTNQYSRFSLADNKVEEGYPTDITSSNWGSFHAHVKSLRFGFSTPTQSILYVMAPDTLWLFYDVDGTPMVCEYDQALDKVIGNYRLEDSRWHSLLPYFNRIVAGISWGTNGPRDTFSFITNDGDHIDFNSKTNTITPASWPVLQPYKNRIITAAKNNTPLLDTFYYIFLTNNEYLRYNLRSKEVTGPKKVDDSTWPGLLSD